MLPPAMRFLADEHVPPPVIAFLRDRGHVVDSVRGSPLRGEADEVIAKAAHESSAIVVTWNHRHYAELISRRPPLNRDRFPNAGRLSFVCPEPLGRRRLEALLDDIEHEHRIVQARRDKRLIMVIGDTWFRINR